MNNSVRDGVALQYGSEPSTNIVSQGMPFRVLTSTTTGREIHSYSVPLINSLVGVTSQKFFNIGRTSKLQLVFQTAGILPITLDNTGGTTLSTAASFTVTLSDFSIQRNT